VINNISSAYATMNNLLCGLHKEYILSKYMAKRNGDKTDKNVFRRFGHRFNN